MESDDRIPNESGEILEELARYDSSNWCVRGSSILQTSDEIGKQGDSAEFMRQLIMKMGVESRFAGVQQSGQISTESEHGWITEKFPDTTYVRLPITIDAWGEQKLNATITHKGNALYRIDIPLRHHGPELLFITLQRFDNSHKKIRHRAVTPAEIKMGDELHTRLASIHPGGPSLDSGHFWVAENAK